MKKALYLFLSALLCLSVTACGDSDEKTVEIKSAEIGDYIEFGEYEQDCEELNGKEPIKWLVLDKEDDKILVISKYALDCKPYNEECEKITWEGCTLREWLNDDFINEAFSKDEQEAIPTVTVTAGEYDTDSGNTEDKVFLLSEDETDEYFDSVSEIECEPTQYAVDNGAWDVGNCCWWLRSLGSPLPHAEWVNHDGSIIGSSVDTYDVAVRPAMWIETK